MPSEDDLDGLFNRLKTAQVPIIEWREEDMGKSLTAIATGPLRGQERKYFRKLRLVGEKACHEA